MGWAELRIVLSKHINPSRMSFKGVGNKLQFEDSCIAESVMLHLRLWMLQHYQCTIALFFIMDIVRVVKWKKLCGAFYERFQADIPVKQELINWSYRKQESEDGDFPAIDIDSSKLTRMYHSGRKGIRVVCETF